jgi:hypothetical protein
MNILVDYDNIPRTHSDKGIIYIIDKILNALGPLPFTGSDRTNAKLYGGWYEDRTLSRRAQDLVVAIHSHFPCNMMIHNSQGSAISRVSVELALSLEIEPTKHLWYTYRRRRFPNGVNCRHPHDLGCQNPECPLLTLSQLLSAGHCPHPGCSIRAEKALFRDEQKLVDSMLASDLIHMAQRGETDICVVTSDDDFWPPIRTALLLGSRVAHVHTHSNRTTPHYYCGSVGPTYIQHSL